MGGMKVTFSVKTVKVDEQKYTKKEKEEAMARWRFLFPSGGKIALTLFLIFATYLTLPIAYFGRTGTEFLSFVRFIFPVQPSLPFFIVQIILYYILSCIAIGVLGLVFSPRDAK
jgi:hypothetical protein